MLAHIKKISVVVLLFLLLHISASAYSLNIDKERVDSVKIYTLYPYPEHIRGAVPLNLMLNTRGSIDKIVDTLNAMVLIKPPQNGDGGTGTGFFIEINYDNGGVEKYTQYGYDFYMGDLNEDENAESYYIVNHPFMEFYEGALYKTNTIPSDWAKEDVQNADELQVIPETVRNNYKQYITREQFCALVLNVLYSSDKVKNRLDKDLAANVFKDTDNASVNILYQNGIVTGKSECEFFPLDYISLEEAMTILGRIIEKFHINTSPVEFAPDTAKDVSPWAQEYIGQVLPLYVDNLDTANNNFKTSIISEVAISMVIQLLYIMP